MNDRNLDEDFLTIKEFSKYVGISASALRHYDRIGAFVPAKHGVDQENKYRYYSPVQITTAKMIRVMREIGVPLGTIKKLRENRTPEKLLRILRTHWNDIADEMRLLQEISSVISVFTDLLKEAISVIESDLTMAEIPERQILLGEKTDYTGETGFMREFLNFCNAPHIPKLNTSFPIGGYWDNMSGFLKESSRPERFFSLDPKGHEKKEAGLYLTGYTRGYYGQTNDLPKRMVEYADENGLLFSGPVYNIYLADEISVNNPEQYLLQVSAAVIETRQKSNRRRNHRC